MDHISVPQGALTEPVTIPFYVASEHKYRKHGFLAFPKLKNFDKDYLTSTDASPKTFSSFMSFLQSWALLALLQEGFAVLNISVKEEDFIENSEDGSSRICTSKIPSLLNTWTRHEKQDPEKAELLQLAKALVLIDDYLGLIMDTGPQTFIGQRLDPEKVQAIDELILSIACVAEVFDSVIFHYTGEKYVQVRLGQTLMRRYKEVGWCPHLIQSVKTDIASTTAHYYNSFIDRRSDDQDHTKCWDSESCAVFHGIVEAYRNPHAEHCDEATCIYSKVTGDQLQILGRIIRDGNIPVLTFCSNTTGEAALKVHVFQRPLHGQQTENGNGEVQHYAAYSHVWLDGLGDPLGQGMRSCQLNRLQKLANQAMSVSKALVPFWVDILCVPQERELRWLAIDGMRHVYREARATIVLDRHLLKLHGQCTPEQIAQTIVTSNWRMRLWTLQEGLLANNLIFRLGDGFVPSQMLLAVYLQTLQDRDQIFRFGTSASAQIVERKMSVDRLFIVAFGITSTKDNLLLDSSHPATILDELLNRLAGRSTSRREDEAICLSILLGQDPGKYYELSDVHEERMQALFLSLEQIPLRLIFRSGPRLSSPGCGWLPLSLLRMPWQPEMPPVHGVGYPSKRGLLFSFPGYKIRVSGEDASRAVQKGLNVSIGSMSSVQYWAAFVQKWERSAQRWPEFAEQDLALIPCKDLGEGEGDIRCIIAGDVTNEEGIRYARFLALLDLIPHMNLSAEREALSGHVALEKFEPAPQWCIS